MMRFGWVITRYVATLMISGSTLFYPAPKLLWNASTSVPIGLYTVHRASALYVGELLVITPPEPLATFLDQRRYLPKGVPLLKRVVALPGQTVCRASVTKIARRRYIDPQRPMVRYKYSIFCPKGRIWFDDQLKGLRGILSSITVYAHQYHIELVEIDSGIDTRRKLRETIADPVMRRGLGYGPRKRRTRRPHRSHRVEQAHHGPSRHSAANGDDGGSTAAQRRCG